MDNYLTGITIVDFSTRLPGPLSTYVLQSLGAKIIKIEDQNNCDPFVSEEFTKLNPCFAHWYENLNAHKDIQKIDLSDFSSHKELIENADAVLLPKSKKLIEKLKDLKLNNVIYIAGGEGQFKSLHDLNALALTKTFSLHGNQSNHPPYLPFAGVAFGQYLATTILAGIINFQKKKTPIKTTVYLKETTELIFDSLYSESFTEKPLQLHNGAFPCYSLYRSKDNKSLALAAVEAKYWNLFCETFQLKFTLDQRFDQSGSTFDKIKNMFAKLDANEISEKLKNLDICLTLQA